jgi:hypothetical protein
VADEILERALAAHALPVEIPAGPDPLRFADADEARAALGAAGFDLASLRVETVTVPWRVPTPELLFEAHLRAGVLVSTVLQAQPPERLAAIRAAIVEDVERYADGDEFALPIAARVVSAATPSR